MFNTTCSTTHATFSEYILSTQITNEVGVFLHSGLSGLTLHKLFMQIKLPHRRSMLYDLFWKKTHKKYQFSVFFKFC